MLALGTVAALETATQEAEQGKRLEEERRRM